MKWRELVPFLRQLWQRPAGPLSLAPNDSRSVLAVKGPLRRFAPWTAPGRSGEGCLRGKEGNRSTSDFVCHLIVFDSIAPHPNRRAWFSSPPLRGPGGSPPGKSLCET